uniref:Uncharacterized protein n=1 Tax=Rhizophora mucronata TaxID=61149 RepID=A0A2P2J5I5_RHIMU
MLNCLFVSLFSFYDKFFDKNNDRSSPLLYFSSLLLLLFSHAISSSLITKASMLSTQAIKSICTGTRKPIKNHAFIPFAKKQPKTLVLHPCIQYNRKQSCSSNIDSLLQKPVCLKPVQRLPKCLNPIIKTAKIK